MKLTAKLLFNIKFGETANKNIEKFSVFEGTAPPRSYGNSTAKEKGNFGCAERYKNERNICNYSGF